MLTRGGKHFDQGHGKGLPYSKVMRFEPHTIHLKSRLEEWRLEITAMRKAVWPYRRIARWLREEKEVCISPEAVRQFCIVRGIEKGNPPSSAKVAAKERTATKRASGSCRRNETVRIFDYDDSQPIQRRKP